MLGLSPYVQRRRALVASATSRVLTGLVCLAPTPASGPWIVVVGRWASRAPVRDRHGFLADLLGRHAGLGKAEGVAAECVR